MSYVIFQCKNKCAHSLENVRFYHFEKNPNFTIFKCKCGFAIKHQNVLSKKK